MYLYRSATLSSIECIHTFVEFTEDIIRSHNCFKDFALAGGVQPMMSLMTIPRIAFSYTSSPTCTSIILTCAVISEYVEVRYMYM